MMLNKMKSGFLVAAVVALFFIVSLVIGFALVDTATVNVDEQPAEVTQDNASVTVIREATLPRPFMGDTIRQASLNWADFSEAIPREDALPRPSMGDTIRQASLNWADYAELTLPEPSMADTIRQASLNWADYTETVEAKSSQPRFFMGDALYQASLNWADYVGTDTQAYELPESDANSKGTAKPY